VLASEEWASKNGKEVLATIIAQAAVADDFPLPRPHARPTAAIKALERVGLTPEDVDLWEINEAFAVGRAELDPDARAWTRTRSTSTAAPWRSATPVGASGARILGTLVFELRRRGGGVGVAAICSGGGQGDAVVVKV
jgi:acetyl-CoA C-acetyltransferase